MPTEYNLIQRPDLQQRLTRGLSIVGEKSPARTLDPTVQAVVMLEDLTRGGTPFDQPVDRRAGTSSGPIAAVAGEIALALVVNPANSGLVAVLDTISWWGDATCEFIIGRFQNTGIALVAPGDYYDLRHGPNSPVEVWGGTNAASVVTAELARLKGNSTGAGYTWSNLPPIVLSPGEAAGLEMVTANVRCGASFAWLEYTA